MNAEINELAQRAGIVFPGAVDWLPREVDDKGRFGELALDAQPALVTTSNAGIPAMLTTYVDPKLIEVLLTPNKAEEIYGTTKKGDWLDETAMFTVVENTGFVSSYGDFANNGRAGVNVQFPQRQSYLFQTFTVWGEREMERAGRAKIDWAARLNIASAITLEKARTAYYFYGVAGLQNYGALNDPSLSAAITPTTKAATGTSWSVATPTEIVADIQKMYAALVGTSQANGNVQLDSPMTLVVSPVSETYLVTPNSFGLNAMQLLTKTFPNLKVKTAVQMLSGTTYSAQLFADSIQGQPVIECAFNEKMRAHPVTQMPSAWKQKKTAGTWGAVVYQPFAVVNMAGI